MVPKQYTNPTIFPMKGTNSSFLIVLAQTTHRLCRGHINKMTPATLIAGAKTRHETLYALLRKNQNTHSWRTSECLTNINHPQQGVK